MVNILFIRKHQVEKHIEGLTLENLITGVAKSKLTNVNVMISIEGNFKSLSIMTIVGIVAGASETSKLKIAQMYQKLLHCKKAQPWMKQFKYKDGEWSFEEKMDGMAKYELMTIKKEIVYIEETLITMIMNA